MKLFFVIMGLSATGKSRLIHRLLCPAGQVYRDRFGIDGPLSVFQSGVKFPDGVEYILYEWQFDEQRLKGLISQGIPMKAIVIWRDPRYHLADVHSYRQPWHPSEDKLREQFHINLMPIIKGLGIEYEIVDGGSDNYSRIVW